MDRHITIAGHGRAGTTLFYNMLRATLQGFNLPPEECPSQALIQKAGSHCTKRPLDIFAVESLPKWNWRRKQLDLIVTIRDPRDMLVSVHSAVPGEYFVGADHTWFIPGDRPPTFTGPGLLQVHNQILNIVSSDLYPQGAFVLKYEDLIADPVAIQNELAGKLGLCFEGSFLDVDKSVIPEALSGPLNGIRPVDSNSVAKWRRPEHRDRIIDQFTRFPDLHALVFRMGYETDTKWLEDMIMESIAQS
jgi:hypothetical protein